MRTKSWEMFEDSFGRFVHPKNRTSQNLAGKTRLCSDLFALRAQVPVPAGRLARPDLMFSEQK